MKQLKRYLILGLALAMLAGALAVPSSAATEGEKIFYKLVPRTVNPVIGEVFEVAVEITTEMNEPQDFNIAAMRFYVHYSNEYFEPLGYRGAGQAIVQEIDPQSGMYSYDLMGAFSKDDETNKGFGIRDASTPSEREKYPSEIPSIMVSSYNALLVQWIAPIEDNVVQFIDDPQEEEIMILRFRVKQTAPLTTAGGTIAIFKGYPGMDYPFYMERYSEALPPPGILSYAPTGNVGVNDPSFPIDVSGANCLIKPVPPAPTLQEKQGGAKIKELSPADKAEYGYDGIIYSFPAVMTQQGTPVRWIDPETGDGAYDARLDNFVEATNMGVLKVSNDNARKSEHPTDYGTGTLVELWDAAETACVAKYYLVVFGDLDGNFIINHDDYVEFLAIQAGLRVEEKFDPASINPYDSPYHMAATVASPGHAGTISNGDLALLYTIAIGIEENYTQPTLI
ncbi:MAG: hypothetical protein FWH26_00700 [Oscillospiraceae bacterium]|nr:hypothetical protein [Oscillospiraceae bacterium]